MAEIDEKDRIINMSWILGNIEKFSDCNVNCTFDPQGAMVGYTVVVKCYDNTDYSQAFIDQCRVNFSAKKYTVYNNYGGLYIKFEASFI